MITATESLADQAYRRVRRMICTAELEPGAVISESELCEQLGVGRTPVREAVRALAAEHLIDVYPRRGMFVAGVDPRDLRSISEVREQLEPFAARLAATRRDEDDLAEIDDLHLVSRAHEGHPSAPSRTRASRDPPGDQRRRCRARGHGDEQAHRGIRSGDAPRPVAAERRRHEKGKGKEDG